VCDSKKFFYDCYAGEAGSIHDACLFRRSELGQNLGNRQFPQNGHLIGDSAYPLVKQLLVQFFFSKRVLAAEHTANNIVFM
jgi:hypothetical protein